MLKTGHADRGTSRGFGYSGKLMIHQIGTDFAAKSPLDRRIICNFVVVFCSRFRYSK